MCSFASFQKNKGGSFPFIQNLAVTIWSNYSTRLTPDEFQEMGSKLLAENRDPQELTKVRCPQHVITNTRADTIAEQF